MKIDKLFFGEYKSTDLKVQCPLAVAKWLLKLLMRIGN